MNRNTKRAPELPAESDADRLAHTLGIVAYHVRCIATETAPCRFTLCAHGDVYDVVIWRADRSATRAIGKDNGVVDADVWDPVSIMRQGSGGDPEAYGTGTDSYSGNRAGACVWYGKAIGAELARARLPGAVVAVAP